MNITNVINGQTIGCLKINKIKSYAHIEGLICERSEGLITGGVLSSDVKEIKIIRSSFL